MKGFAIEDRRLTWLVGYGNGGRQVKGGEV